MERRLTPLSNSLSIRGPMCPCMPSRRLAEFALVFVLALSAAVRVTANALAFPFFGHVDEFQHLDVLLKYESGEMPSVEGDAYLPRTLWLKDYYGSPEYVQAGNLPFPPVIWPTDVRERFLASFMEEVKLPSVLNHNYEAMQPPVYYWSTVLWSSLGRAFGFVGGVSELYWLRCFGSVLAALLVLLTYQWVLLAWPQAPPLLRVGAPALVAFLPQDCFYFISNDAMGAVTVAGALVLLLLLRRNDALGDARSGAALRSGMGLGMALGAATSASLLVKVTNLPLLFPLAYVVLVRCRDLRARGRRVFDAAHAAMLAAFAVPFATWATYAIAVSGEVFGSAHKTSFCGFQDQTWAGVLGHPIWSLEGLWTFFSTLSARFIRGETHWNGVEMGMPALDVGLFIVSIVCLVASGVATLRRRSAALPLAVAAPLWILLLAAVAMMFGLSLYWDFAKSASPSRDFPYMVNGRMIACALLPFAVLFVDGLLRLTRRLGRPSPLAVLAVILAALFVSEILLMLPVVESPYNFFNLDL